jgi:hypothetical protein
MNCLLWPSLLEVGLFVIGFVGGFFLASILRGADDKLPDECVGRECWKK